MVCKSDIRLEIEKIEDKFFKDEDYNNTISLGLSLINKLDKTDNKYYIWRCYSLIAKSYSELKNYRRARDYAKMANWFAENESVERVDNMEVLARCSANLGEIDLAIKCFDKCITIYRNTNVQRGLARALHNKAIKIVYYDNAIDDIKEAVDIYEKLHNENQLPRIKTLDNAYFNLCDLYIKHNKIGRVYEVLKIMNNEMDKKEIKSMLKALNVQQRNVVGI